MSDNDPHAQDSKFDIVDVDVRTWVETARANPTLYRDRQVTEIVLGAIGLAPSLSKTLVLKGGAVMALAFKSNRVTGDVDFTSMAEPADLTEKLTTELNELLPRTAIKLGYPDLLCRVQSVKKMPRAENFEDHEFPALRVRIGSAKRGTGEEARLADGQASRVLDVEMALLRNSGLRRDYPLPLWRHATRAISAVPMALKRFMRAMRIWISAVWRSGSLAAMRSPKDFRHRIFASIRLRAWYPVQRFQNARP